MEYGRITDIDLAQQTGIRPAGADQTEFYFCTEKKTKCDERFGTRLNTITKNRIESDYSHPGFSFSYHQLL